MPCVYVWSAIAFWVLIIFFFFFIFNIILPQSIVAATLGAPAFSDGRYNPKAYNQNAGMWICCCCQNRPKTRFCKIIAKLQWNGRRIRHLFFNIYHIWSQITWFHNQFVIILHYFYFYISIHHSLFNFPAKSFHLNSHFDYDEKISSSICWFDRRYILECIWAILIENVITRYASHFSYDKMNRLVFLQMTNHMLINSKHFEIR